MKVERVRFISPIEREWDELADRNAAPPWMRPGWVAGWLEAFAPADLEVVYARAADGRLTGVFPVVRSSKALRAAGNTESPAVGMLVEGHEVAEAIARDVLAHGPRRLEMLYMTKGEADTAGFLRTAEAMGYAISARTVMRSPYLSIAGGWEAFLERRGTAPFREERRKHRMLQKEGALTFEIALGGDDLERHLREAVAIERSGWKGRSETAIADDPNVLRFYESVARWASERGWLRLIFLRLEGRAIAFDLALEERGVLYLLKTSYEEEFRRFSPGRVLRWLAIRSACDSDLERYEFLGNDDEYKRKWADDYHDRLLIRGFGRTLLAHASRYGYDRFVSVRRGYLGPLKRRVLRELSARNPSTRRRRTGSGT